MRPHPYIAAAIAVLVFLPNLYWLFQNHFAPASYIHNRYAIGSRLAPHLLHPVNFCFWQVLFIAPMAVTLVPWTDRWQFRPITEERERWSARFLLAIALGPFVGFMLVAMVGGLKLDKTIWGLPFWLFIPLTGLFFLRSSPAPSALRDTIIVGLGLVGVNIIAGATIPLFWPALTGKALPRTQFPGRLLSEEIGHIWHDRFPNAPLRIVAGERWLTYNVAFYSPERPSVLTDQSRLWSSAIAEASCPWTSVLQLETSGGILLWYPDREGSDLPPSLRRIAPSAHVFGTLSLPWQTRARLPPVRVGVAVVPPH